MSKLTDTQLVVLAAAAARPKHAVLPPPVTIFLKKAALTKVITSLLKRTLITEEPATAGDEVWREDGDQRFTLTITTAGLEAIGVDTREQPPSVEEEPVAALPASRRSTGKVEAVLDLLGRAEGASIAEMNAVTDWQAHSIRAFLSGLRKKGTEVIRTKDDAGKAIYRIGIKSPATVLES